MKSIIVIFIILFCFFIACNSQNVFGQKTPLEQTQQSYFFNNTALFDIVYESDTVVTISVRYYFKEEPLISPRSTIDWTYDYVFYKKENNSWKHQKTTGYSFSEAENFQRYLEQFTEEEADSISRDFPWGELPYFFDLEDFRYKLHQSELILAHDTTMIDYFKKNAEKFEELRKRTVEIHKENPDNRWVYLSEESSFRPQLRDLLLTDVQSESEPNETDPYLIWFNLSGERFHNAVGYLYCPDEKDRPKIGNKIMGYVLTIPIEKGWYLFKCL